MNPLVSCIVPNYNGAEFIGRALESLFAQDYPNKQIVVIDDASTDESLREVAKLCKNSSCQVYILKNEKNLGRSPTRNKGIRHVMEKTDIYAFLDSDDWYEPTKISRSVELMAEDPQVIGVVYSDFVAHNLVDNITVREFRPPFSARGMLETCQINNDSIVSKLALEYCGLYDEEMEVAEDYDLWLRITRRFLAVHIPEELLHVTINKGNATHSVPPHIWQKNWARIRAKLSQ